jgi:hypothetical protein
MSKTFAVIAAVAAIVIIVLVIAVTWKGSRENGDGTPPPHAIDQSG